MAAPTVSARANTVSSTTNAGTFTVTLPSHSTGQLLLSCVSSDGNTQLANSNWTKAGETADATAAVSGSIFYRVATSNAESNPVFSTGASEQFSAITFSISLPANTTNFRVEIANSQGSSTNSDPPNLAFTFAPKDFLIIATRHGDSTTVATVNSANYSTLTTATGGGTQGASTNTEERTLTAASSENPGTFTSANEQWVSFTIAISGYNLVSDGATFPQNTAVTSLVSNSTWRASPPALASSGNETGNSNGTWQASPPALTSATNETGNANSIFIATGNPGANAILDGLANSSSNTAQTYFETVPYTAQAGITPGATSTGLDDTFNAIRMYSFMFSSGVSAGPIPDCIVTAFASTNVAVQVADFAPSYIPGSLGSGEFGVLQMYSPLFMNGDGTGTATDPYYTMAIITSNSAISMNSNGQIGGVPAANGSAQTYFEVVPLNANALFTGIGNVTSLATSLAIVSGNQSETGIVNTNPTGAMLGAANESGTGSKTMQANLTISATGNESGVGSKTMQANSSTSVSSNGTANGTGTSTPNGAFTSITNETGTANGSLRPISNLTSNSTQSAAANTSQLQTITISVAGLTTFTSNVSTSANGSLGANGVETALAGGSTGAASFLVAENFSGSITANQFSTFAASVGTSLSSNVITTQSATHTMSVASLTTFTSNVSTSSNGSFGTGGVVISNAGGATVAQSIFSAAGMSGSANSTQFTAFIASVGSAISFTSITTRSANSAMASGTGVNSSPTTTSNTAGSFGTSESANGSVIAINTPNQTLNVNTNLNIPSVTMVTQARTDINIAAGILVQSIRQTIASAIMSGRLDIAGVSKIVNLTVSIGRAMGFIIG